MEPLSAYILTCNSEEFIGKLLRIIEPAVDEIVVLDSGSVDRTREIATQFPKVRWLFRALDDFSAQRNYALDQCASRYVLFLDSDEVPDEEFMHSVMRLRREGFRSDAYSVLREWKVLNGKSVHCVYPCSVPSLILCLLDKSKCGYFPGSSNMVHETISGYDTCELLPGRLHHYTFRTREEIARKLALYSDLAARDLLRRKKPPHWFRRTLNPYAAFIKWYFLKKGFLDGWTGVIFGMYAFNYTREKYRKAAKLSAREGGKPEQ